MNNLATQQPQQTGLPAIIERAALDPTFDIEKLQRLLDMQEAAEIRNADRAFTAALSAAEAEMETINTNANNPQTRSRYATFAQVDREARPIYTRHGFAISFTTEPMSTPETLLVVGTLSHRLGASKRHQVPVPIVTKGIAGKEMMTPIHATMTSISYGKRNLEILMFNLAIGDDTDGNAPRRPPQQQRQEFNRPTHNPNASSMPAEVDPFTGEVIENAADYHVDPVAITFGPSDDFRSWGEKLMWGVRKSLTIDEVDQWILLNQENLMRLRDTKPAMFATLQSAIDTVKEGFTQA
jgi:hypothetical protein